MTASGAEHVFHPKAVAASHIHSALARRALEVVCLFSSVAAAFGNVGPANYAAANGYLDVLPGASVPSTYKRPN